MEKFVHLASENGNHYLVFSKQNSFTLIELRKNREIFRLIENMPFERNQTAHVNYLPLALREEKGGEPLLVVVATEGDQSSYLEINLTSHAVRALNPLIKYDERTSSIVTDDGQIISSGARNRKRIFENLTRGTLFAGEIGGSRVLFPWMGIKPSSDKIFMPYYEGSKEGGWYDLVNQVFTPSQPAAATKEVLSIRILHVKEYGEDFFDDSATNFSGVEIFRHDRVEHYELPDFVQSARARIFKNREGFSYLAIGSNEKKVDSKNSSLILLNLHTMEERIIDLQTAEVSKIERIFETPAGNLEVLFDTLKGLAVVQIYGPLN